MLESPATDPGRAAEETRDRIARFLWDERYGHLPDASWDQALEIAEGIPDGLAASSLHEMRMRADRLLAGPLAKLIAQRDEARGYENRNGNAARYWEWIHAEKDKRLARAEAEAAQLRARLEEAEKTDDFWREVLEGSSARWREAAQMALNGDPRRLQRLLSASRNPIVGSSTQQEAGDGR